MQSILRSKRFWLAIAGVVGAALGDKLPINQEQLQQIIMVIAAWIVGDSLRATNPSQPQPMRTYR